MQYVTLQNDFHNSEVRVRVPIIPCTLSVGQTRRISRELCGLHDCRCGVVRGRQADWEGTELEITQEFDPHDGTAYYHIEYA